MLLVLILSRLLAKLLSYNRVFELLGDLFKLLWWIELECSGEGSLPHHRYSTHPMIGIDWGKEANFDYCRMHLWQVTFSTLSRIAS